MISAIILGIVLAVWLSSIRKYEPEQGQLSVIRFFKKHVMTVGVGVPNIPIKKEVFDIPGVDLSIKIDSNKSVYFLIWPFNVAVFDYRYKKFRTLKEIKDTKGEIRWQPPIEKDKSGKP